MKLLVGLLLAVSGAAYAQQQVILDAMGRPYMYINKAGTSTVYMDAMGRPVAYGVTTTPLPMAERAAAVTTKPVPTFLEPVNMGLPPLAPSVSGSALPTAAQMFPVPTLY